MEPLFAALVDDPEDLDRYLVYADMLQSRGDPRGELVALQCKRERTPEQQARERELIAMHEQPLRERVPKIELAWRYGFVHAITLDGTLAARVKGLFADPCLALVHAIRFRHQGSIDEHIAALLEAPPQTVVDIAIGQRNSAQPDRLDEVLAHFPRLRGLELATLRAPNPTALRGLERLSLWLRDLASGLPELVAEPWPRLRRFVIANRYAFDHATAAYQQLAPIYEGIAMPALVDLAVMIAGFEDRAIAELPRCAAWPRLRSFGLPWFRLTIAGERALEAARNAFENVELTWPRPPGEELKPDDRFQLGRLLRQRLHRPLAALVHYETVCAGEPTGDQLFGLGNAYGDLGRVADQLATYDRAVALAPELVTAWSRRGALLVELGRFDEAAASFERAPAHPNALDQLAQLRRRQGRFDEATALFEKAIAIEPTHAASRHLFDGLLEAGQFAAALDYIRLARTRQPGDRQLIRKEARAHLALGEPLDALAIADELVRSGEVEYWDRYTRFAALRDLGRIADALAICAELEANPEPAYAHVGTLQRALLTQTVPAIAHASSTDHAREVQLALLAIAAAALGGGSTIDARAAFDALVTPRPPGYALDRRWDLTDLVEHVDDPALSSAYAIATGRASSRC